MKRDKTSPVARVTVRMCKLERVSVERLELQLTICLQYLHTLKPLTPMLSWGSM